MHAHREPPWKTPKRNECIEMVLYLTHVKPLFFYLILTLWTEKVVHRQ